MRSRIVGDDGKGTWSEPLNRKNLRRMRSFLRRLGIICRHRRNCGMWHGVEVEDWAWIQIAEAHGLSISFDEEGNPLS